MTGIQKSKQYTLEEVFFPFLALLTANSPGTGIKIDLVWLPQLLSDLCREYPNLFEQDFGGDDENHLLRVLESNTGTFRYFSYLGPPSAHLHLLDWSVSQALLRPHGSRC